jgi:hypothetical protein
VKALFLMVLVACGGGAPPVTDITTAASYEEEQRACVDKAATRADADACRDKIKQKYGRDAGQ